MQQLLFSPSSPKLSSGLLQWWVCLDRGTMTGQPCVCVLSVSFQLCVLGCGPQLLLLQLCGAAGLCLGVGLNASLFNLCVFSEVCLHLRICTILCCCQCGACD